MVRSPTHAALVVLLAAMLVPTVAGILRELPSIGPPAGAEAAPPATSGARPALDLIDTGVAIDPGTWSMFPGSSVALAASADGLPEGCAVYAAWFVWSLPGVSFDRAYLNATSGPSVELTALPNASGTVAVDVDATFSVFCDDYSSADAGPTAVAEVRILPALGLSAVAATPDPAAPDRPVAVAWQIEGGAPPYQVNVAFGDGNRSTIAQEAPGNGSMLHVYAPGAFVPEVDVVDGRGDAMNRSDPTPILCAPGLAVSLDPSTTTAELGEPFEENVTLDGGYGPIDATWRVNGTVVAGTWGDGGPQLAVVPTSLGRIAVSLAVADDVGDVASANDSLPVVGGPTTTLAPLPDGADLGRPAAARGSLTGGVGPFSIRWSQLPNGSNGTAEVASDGSFLLPLVPSIAGELLVDVVVTDRDGGTSTATFDLGHVGLPPSAVLVAPAGPLEAGDPMAVGLEVLGGVGPFDWAIVTAPGLAGATLPSGTNGSGGRIRWNGTPSAPGNLSVTARVVDSFGSLAEANLSLPILPALQLAVAVDNTSAPGALVVYAHVAGGVPPYALRATAGGVGASDYNLSVAGGYTLELTRPSAGFDAVEVELTDSGDGDVRSATTVLVAPLAFGATPPAPASVVAGAPATFPGWDAGIGLGGLVVSAVVGYLIVRRRRTDRGSPTPGARALDLVRRSLQGAEGLDEETLRLLAEEEGVAPGALRSAVDRWGRLGRLRREPDAYGGELLSWVDSAPGAPSAPPTEAP